MIGEYFIDQCLTACISLKSETRKTTEVIDSILYILNWSKKEIPKDNFPIEFSNKFDLLFYVAKYREDHRNFDLQRMVAGLQSGKFANMIPLIEAKDIQLDEKEQKDLLTQIYKKRKLCELTVGKREITQKLTDLESGFHSDDEEMIEVWESMVNTLHTQLVNVKKLESLEEVSFLDIMVDDFEPVMTKLRSQSDKSESVKSGYHFLYDSLPAGGFEPCRLYLIGGTSGVGKSAILANFIGNAVTQTPPKLNGKKDVFLYITAENLIDETVERLYCLMTGESLSRTKNKYNDPDFTMKTDLVNIVGQTGGNIQMYYVQPKKTTLRDIETLVDRVISSGCNLKAVYLDYLDIIRSGMNLSDLRHELGEVAIGLKNLAVIYRVPVITATQLNRAGYNPEEEASLTQMSESMQKIDNSDFVLFLQNHKEPTIGIPTEMGIPKQCKHIKMTILKNRNGPINRSCNVIMQERIGSEEIFNFRIEEKGQFNNEIINTKYKSQEEEVVTWGSF